MDHMYGLVTNWLQRTLRIGPFIRPMTWSGILVEFEPHDLPMFVLGKFLMTSDVLGILRKWGRIYHCPPLKIVLCNRPRLMKTVKRTLKRARTLFVAFYNPKTGS